MKLFKTLFVIILSLAMLLPVFPAASAEYSEEYFDRSWDEIIVDFLISHDSYHDRVTLGYYNTVTGEEYYYQPDKYMIGASVYKVPLNMAFAEKIYNGEMSWDSEIPTTYEYMMRDSIIYSDNDVSGQLMSNLGGYRSFLNYIAPYLGVDTSNVDYMYYNERFTARQYVTCLKTLYHNSERFPKIIETMLEAEPNNYFRQTEQRYDIAHKYGYWVENYMLCLNDVGIVYTDDPIIIVMFTAGVANAYQLMADYCTLMADYSQYTREKRLAAEAAEAEVLAKTKAEFQQQLEGKELFSLSFEAEKEVITETKETESMNPASCSLLIFAAIAIAAFIALALVIRYGRRRRINVFWGCIAVIVCAVVLIACLFASSIGTLIAKPEGDPQDSVTAFFDSLMAEDYDSAYSLLSGYSSFGLEKEPADAISASVYEALKASYDYELFGACNVDKMQASQQLQLSYLDISAVQAKAKELTMTKLEELVMARPKAEVYDENKQYLPEITEEAYALAVEEALNSADKLYNTVGVQLQLEYIDGKWLIIPNQDLLNALVGGAH